MNILQNPGLRTPLECWNDGILGIKMKTLILNEIEFLKTIIPSLHYSIIPIGVKPEVR
jgi:hypothetical protein